jgi:hypothetical protein
MVRAILSALFLALSLTACAGDSTTTTAAPTEAPTSTTAANAADVVVPIESAPCDLITADDVGTATGLTAAEGREDGPITCVYDVGTDTGVSVFVAIEDGQGRFSGPASLYAAYVEEGEELITGLGASAAYSQALRTIAVDAGDGRFIAVGVNGGYSELAEPRDVLVDLATAALGNL